MREEANLAGRDGIRPWRTLGWSLGIFGALALLSALQNHIWSAGTATPASWGRSLASGAAWMLPWGFVAPLALALAERAGHRRGRPWRFALGHLAAMAMVFVPLWALQQAFSLLAAVLFRGWSADLPRKLLAGPDALVTLLGVPLVYGAVAAAGEALRQARARDQQEARASALSMQLSEARLALLQRQVHPHFLFNALQAVSTLLHRDADAADQVVLSLSALLRRMLEQHAAQEISLGAELDLVGRYLEIEQVRFQDRLRVELDADAAPAQAQVPALVLLPLVENAVRHGLSRKPGPGRIGISARVEGGSLVLAVEDDGPGAVLPVRESVGLGTTRQRLQALYGDRARLDLESSSPGFRAEVRVPL